MKILLAFPTVVTGETHTLYCKLGDDDLETRLVVLYMYTFNEYLIYVLNKVYLEF